MTGYEVLAPLNDDSEFLGCAAGPDGFRTLVTIKRVLPGERHHDEFAEMFVDEVGRGLGLTHRNIAELIDASAHGELVMIREFIAGKTLAKLINAQLPLNIACRVMHDVCLGLHAAHPFVHRDVAPKNVLLSYAGEVKVVDFGLSKVTDHGVHARRVTSYLSPEQIRGLRIDARSDLFSAGAVFWELLTGTRAFPGEEAAAQAILEGRIAAPSTVNPRVPRGIDDVILKALAPAPDDRHQTGEQFARAIAAACRLADDDELARWMRDRFPTQLAASRELFALSQANTRPSKAVLSNLVQRITDAQMTTPAPKRPTMFIVTVIAVLAVAALLFLLRGG